MAQRGLLREQFVVSQAQSKLGLKGYPGLNQIIVSGPFYIEKFFCSINVNNLDTF